MTAVFLTACSGEAERQPQGPVEQAFLERLEQAEVDLDQDAALAYLDWHCPNRVEPMEDYVERAREAGAGSDAAADQVVDAAANACRLADTPTGG